MATGSTISPTRWFHTTGPPAVAGRRGSKKRGIVASASAGAPSPAPEPQPSDEQRGASSLPPAGASPAGRGLPVWPLLLRALALHAANITARVLARPLLPVTQRLDASAAASPAVHAACARLQVDDLAGLHDLANALVLAEAVYKVVDRPESEALRLLSALKAAFPAGVVTLRCAQFARPHVRHRFVVAEGGDALYVGLMGTKLARDYLANATVWQEEVRLDAALLSTDDVERVGPGPQAATPGAGAAAAAGAPPAQPPAAHRGFVTRARGIPIDALYHEARARGKRLVLCGHSLGGAVAQLCTLHLLQALPREEHASVACISFAAPALGNQALASLAVECGWDQRMRNYLMPDDPIPHLLSARRPPSQTASGTGLAAAATVGSAVAPGAAPLSKPGPAVEQHAQEQQPPPPPAVVIFQAANNISAVSGRMLRREGAHKAAAAAFTGPLAPLGSAGSSGLEPASSAREHGTGAAGGDTLPADVAASHGPRRRLGAALGAAAAGPARTAASAALGAARLMALPLTAPIRAAVPTPQYQPMGRQLYIMPDAVRYEADGGGLAATAAWAVPPAAAAAAPASAGGGGAGERGAPGLGGWAPWASLLRGAWSAAGLDGASGVPPISGSLDDDDDNVDVAAAAAAAGGVVPDRLPRRTLFPSHRMVTYRTRLLTICQESLGNATWRSVLHPAAAAAALPHLPNVPHPGDVVADYLLAPGIFPLRAQASTVDPLPPPAPPARADEGGAAALGPPQLHVAAAALLEQQQQRGKQGGAAAAASTEQQQQPRRRRRWVWPWHALLRRSAPSADAAPVEVVVRIEGRGLSNVTTAWISGACRDGRGGAVPVAVDVVTRPEAPAPLAALRRPPMPLLAPLSAFASWLALAAGWVAVLRRLQPAGGGDYLLARARLPAGAVRAAQRAAADPLLVAVGEAPRLMVHLQSDFAVHSLPLDIRIGCGGVGPAGWGLPGGTGAGARLRGGFKDASLFLRQHSALGWPRWGMQPAGGGRAL